MTLLRVNVPASDFGVEAKVVNVTAASEGEHSREGAVSSRHPSNSCPKGTRSGPTQKMGGPFEQSFLKF